MFYKLKQELNNEINAESLIQNYKKYFIFIYLWQENQLKISVNLNMQ